MVFNVAGTQDGISLFRFQPSNESDGSLRAHKIYKEQLWFSSPKRLNDPMDVDHPIDDLTFDDTGNSPVLQAMARAMYMHDKACYPRNFVDQHLLGHITEWIESSGNSISLCTEFRERFLRVGVACFTRSWNSPPMWAHYGEGWQGFVIEYAVNQMSLASANDTIGFWQFWMNYTSQIRTTALSELLLSPYEAAVRILSTKTLPWSYEQEWRLVSLEGGDQSFALPTGMQMKSIIRGPKSSNSQTEVLRQKCKDWDIPLHHVIVGLDRTLHLRNESNG